MPENFARLHAYWASLAPGGGVPERRMLNPNVLRDLLPKIMIFGRDAEARARCRLMGTYCVDRFGANLTGKDLMSMMGPQSRSLLEDSIARVCAEGNGLVLHLRIKTRAPNTRVSRMLMLPLRADNGCQMLGLLSPSLDLPANSLPSADGRPDRLLLESIAIFDSASGDIRPRVQPDISFAD